MYFVGGLPMSKIGHDYIYAIVDRLSTMCIFIPCKNHTTAYQTAQIFFQYVWVHFELPTSII